MPKEVTTTRSSKSVRLTRRAAGLREAIAPSGGRDRRRRSTLGRLAAEDSVHQVLHALARRFLVERHGILNRDPTASATSTATMATV